jgi:hypothetical protein
MATLADGIDFVLSYLRGTKSSSGVDHSGQSGVVTTLYMVFSFLWLTIWGKFSDRDFSAILTGASFVQLVGFFILSVKIHATKSVVGLSSKTLTLYVLYLSTRLTATSLKSGYNPVDRTGDYMYQLIDAFSLVTVLQVLYCVHKTHAHSYQEEHDTISLGPLVIPCVLLGTFVHGSFNGNFFFDAIWAVSVNFETVAMIPQLWMMARMGGRVDSMTAHFVAAIITSNVMTIVWWWYCGPELEKRGPCMLAKVIMASQVIKVVLSADFMYYYAMAWLGGTALVLPDAAEM